MKRKNPGELRAGCGFRLIPLLAAIALISAAGAQRAHADLEVAKSIRGGLTRVNAGTQFTYVLSYRAASTTTNFYNAFLTDVLPVGLNYASAVGTPHTSNITYTAATRTIRVNFINPLPAGSTGEIEINVLYPNGTTPDGTITTNRATAQATNSPPYTSNPITIMATASNRATLTKTLVGSSVPLNQNVSYTVTLNNNISVGALNITNITMTDTLPPGSIFVAASGGGSYDAGSHSVTWTQQTLGIGNMARTVTVRFPAPPFALSNRVTNVVTAIGTPLGKTPTNWIRGITNIIVNPTTASTFTKSVSEARYVYEGKVVNKTFNMTVNNTGNTPITNVVVTDEIKPEFKVTRFNTGNFNGTPAGLRTGINVYYQKWTGSGWLDAPGNPYTGLTNTTILVSALGLATNDYITDLRWEFGELPVNYSIAGLSFQADAMTTDRAGNPVVAGDVLTNRADLAYYSYLGPSNRSSTVTLNVLSARPVVQLTKAVTNAVPVKDGDTLTFRLILANRAEAAAALQNPVVADLLAGYLTYVPGSWWIQSGPAGLPEPTFTSAPNYNGTSNTLLRWDWSSYSLPTNASIEIRFRASLTPGTLYGGKTNQIHLVEWDNPALDTNATLYARDVNDLNANGSTNDYVYYQNLGYTISSVAAMDSYKWVKGELDTNWHRYPESGFTVPGGIADYRMTVKNVGNVPVKNINVIDILPFVGDTGVIDLSARDTEWRPSLAAPITAPPGVTVYYSEEGDPARPDFVPSGPPGSDAPYWSTNPPADFTRTRSVKFDFGAAVLQPNQELEFGWPMRAPVGAPTGGEIAWNSFGYYGTRTDNNTQLLPSEPIKVGIKILPDTNAVYGDYVWFDENLDGIQDNSEGGMNGIRVHLWQDSGPGGIPDGVRDTDTDHYIGFTITGDDYEGHPGYYLFPNMDRGFYYALFEVPAGAVVSPADQGGDDTKDSDVTLMAGSNYWTEITWLDDAEHDLSWDMGLWVDEYEITLVKLAGNAPDGTTLWVESGAPVRYTYQVLNNGNLDLVNIRVRDDKLGLIGIIPRLASGQSAVLTSTPVNVTADVTNVGDVRGRPAVPGGPEIPGLPEATDDDDAVVRVLARIGDRVWLDTDGDGIQDGGETGIGGVRVFLLDNLGQVVATNTTDANGLYRFTVPPGAYEVQFDLSSVDASYTVSPRGAAGSKDATDSDADPVTGRTELTTIVADESDFSWDMGLWQPSSIGDKVWFDHDSDGIQDGPGEPGAGSIRVYLLNDGGDIMATNTTSSGGLYLFDNLVPGTYSVEFDLTSLPPGYHVSPRTGNLLDADNSDANPSTGRTVPIVLAPNTHIREVDLGIWTASQIGDRVWYDNDGDGLQDLGEPGVTGVTVRLLHGGAAIATTVTDGSGYYLFSNLAPNDYQVEFDLSTLPAGYKPTIRGPTGSSDADDSDADVLTGRTELIAISADEQDLTWDLGLVRFVSDLSLTKTAEPVFEYEQKWSIPISKGMQFTDGDYWLRLESGKPSFDVWGPGNLKSTNVLDSTWHHVVGRFTRGTNDAWGTHTMEILIDGVVVTSKYGRGATDTSDAPLYLGAYLGNSAFYAGLMDEVRLSRGLRSDAWLRASYAQQSAAAAFLSVGAEEAGSVPGYAHRRALTIDHAFIGEDLADFPVLVNVTDEWLAEGVENADGSDLLFTLADGTELAREIELYEQGPGRLVAWVKAPAVSAGSDTTIYVQYGNAAPGAPAHPPTAVWDDGFMMVQHLEEGAGAVADSTANGNDGVVMGATPTEWGSADGGYAFDGKDDKIEVANDPTIQLNTGDFTIEGWFARKALPADTIFTITVQNAGPDEALNVAVEDALSPSFTLVRALATQGSYAEPTWAVGVLEAGESATLQLVAALNGLEMGTNVAEVSASDSSDPDSTPGNHAAGEDDQASAIGLVSVPGGAPGDPDFSIQGVVFDPPVLTADISFTATVTVANNGAVAGNARRLNVWSHREAAPDPGDAGEATDIVGLLGVGETKQFTFTGLRTPAGDGTYRFRAFVDADGDAVEASEANNQKVVTYSYTSGTASKPDFSVQSVVFDPPALASDISFTAVVTVANNSSVAGDAGLLNVWAHKAAAPVAGEPGDASQTVGLLGAGETRQVTFTGLRTPAGDGTYKFRAFVEANGAVAETSEANNQKAVSYSYSAGYVPKPDFSVQSVAFDPPALAADISFTAIVTVANNSSVAGDAGLLNVWAQRAAAPSPGDPGDDAQAAGVLAAGETKQFTFTSLRTPAGDGTYKFRAFVDAAGAAAESSEGNNQKSVTYTIGSSGYVPKPDFLITGISFSPPAPAPGGAFVAYVTVKNQATVSSDAGHVDVWVSKGTSAVVGETGDAWQAVGALAGGESRELVFSGLPAPTNGTRHVFRGFVDSRGAITESSEGNNQSTKAYTY